MLKHKLVDFIIQFMEEVDKEISEMKLFVRFIRLVLDFCFVPTNRPATAQCAGEIRGRVVPNTSKLRLKPHPSCYARLVITRLTLITVRLSNFGQALMSGVGHDRCIIVWRLGMNHDIGYVGGGSPVHAHLLRVLPPLRSMFNHSGAAVLLPLPLRSLVHRHLLPPLVRLSPDSSCEEVGLPFI